MNSLPYSGAAERNRQPILDELVKLIPQNGTVLEIGSGTGQHAVFLTQNLPDLLWQPSDREENLAGLQARVSAEGSTNILPPIKLDVLLDRWPDYCYDAVFSANTAHIMPWRAVRAMFAGVSARLERPSRFCLYGPFNIENRFTSPGNAQFDARLRAEDSRMGIRDVGVLEAMAEMYEMELESRISMPANNFILVFKKL